MPLTTRCGHCGRLFPVYAQQLKAQRGRVQCPQCGDLLDGLAALVDEPGFAGEPTPTRGRAAVRLRGAPAAQSVRPSLIPAAAPTPLRVRTPPAASASAGRPARARLAWVLLSLVLLAALGAQLVWWQRAALARDPTGYRFLSGLCGLLGCEPPLVRLPGALAVLDPSLTPDEAQGALVLRLRIANGAAQPQPAPLIELEFFDQQGDLAAARRFAPGEYTAALPPADAAPTPGAIPVPIGAPLAPGETRAVALVMAAPRMPASGFKVRLQ